MVSNPRIFRDPTPIDVVLDAARRLFASLSSGFLAEGDGYLDALEQIVRPPLLQGALVPDARVAAQCPFMECESCGQLTGFSRVSLT